MHKLSPNGFPILDSVQPIIDVIKDHPEIMNGKNTELGFGSIMYNVIFDNTFLDPATAETEEEAYKRKLMLECRALHYDLETGTILSRSFHKFHNINERNSTRVENVDWSLPHRFLEKIDGTMVAPVRAKRMVWCTKRGYFPLSDKIEEEFVGEDTIYTKFAHTALDAGFTPIFEWFTPRHRIILEATKPSFTLLALRNNQTGEYMQYDDMLAYVPAGIPVVGERFKGMSIADVIATVLEEEQVEGIVVRFDNGQMLKLKSKWYREIHKVVTELKMDKDVLRLIVDGILDDFKPFLFGELLERVNEYERKVVGFWFDKAAEIVKAVDEAKANGVSAHEFSKTYDPVFLKYAMKAFKHNNDVNYVVDAIKRDLTLWYSNQVSLDQKSHYYGHHRLF